MRTRFAPSPTGQLHVGGARTAILNWLLARHHGGAFVLRIEDTDAERNVPGAEAGLLEDLRWLGLDWDEGPDLGGPHAPYRQSERTHLYRARARELLEAGRAYRCTCPPGGEAAGRERPRCPCADAPAATTDPGGASVRLRVPDEGEIAWDDLVRGRIAYRAEHLEDFVLLRSDGRATYNFAAALDDAAMDITHVLRGADHIANTPKQLLVYAAFAWAPPRFGHIPLILGPDRQKLSKRHGATSVAEHRRLGYLPEALVNYLSLLAWSSPSGDEMLPPERLIREIDLGRVGASDAVFDRDKLRWLSGRYLQERPLAEVVDLARPFVEAAGLPLDPARVPAVVEVVRGRVALLSEIGEHLGPFAGPHTPAQQEARRAALADPEARRVLDAVAARLRGPTEWSEAAIDAAVRAAGQDAGAKGRALFAPLRLALTGEEHGPELARVIYALGPARARALLGAAG